MFLNKGKTPKGTVNLVTEFQAVILAGRPSGWGSLDAITDDSELKAEHNIPKAALPVAGKPMIHYQLAWLEAAKVQSVLVLCPQGSKNEIQAQLQKYAGSSDALKFKLICTNHGEGTADALRQIHDEIKSDFIVMSCDVITDLPAHHLIDLHRIHAPAVTTLMYESMQVEGAAPSKGDGYAEYIGIDMEKGRLVFAAPQDTMRFQPPMLRKFPRVRMYTNLRDSHVYIFQRWVLDVIVNDTTISSIRKDLIQRLLRSQYSETARIKLGINDFITSEPDPFYQASLLSTTNSRGTKQLLKLKPRKGGDERESVTEEASGTEETGGKEEKDVKEDPATKEVVCATVICRDAFCARANTIGSYGEINRQRAQVARAAQSATTTDIKAKQAQIGPDSIIESEQIGERCSVKKSVIGKHCTIGKNVKIVNSIIMDHVVIEDFVKLDKCVVSMNAQILANSQLKECEVGPKIVIDKGTIRTGEQFVLSHFLDIDEA
ncbi:hypothetical protein PhCBS80983_g03008 [Powellomyces hirtus]|uniref:Translation initiation factor eIF2B subunit gamma n=1 Tax=Powellomyces hirtus TaxID=109895 RepID=A0A507E5G0_9FUNG|nr:hypothetical protein PhCBS80983_g03008 [Powellomyces hirtus]